ncbi:MAG: tetratricopeptide repeat protein [Gammaproteobacteria bacterium]|nr:tetratricopeptide repeat protein [Gammaproteobacteria bacterium]
MSLLMDALKQAEHAKHSAHPEAPTPPAITPAVDMPADVTELSLTPVEAAASIESATLNIPSIPASTPGLAPELNREPAPQLRIAPEPEPEPREASSAVLAEAEPDPVPAPSAPVQASPEPADIGHHHNSPAAAARILATSAAQQAALRRRNLAGIISLMSLVAIAVGSYYYYAALAQQTPYLGLPQPQPPLVATANMTGDSAPATLDAAAPDISPDISPDTAQPPATAATLPAEPTALDTVPPAETPWQEGPPPAEVHSAQDWEPAPVDPRVLRGEHPAPVADVADAVAPPAATITITHGTQPNQVNLDLQTAYSDFQTGRLAQAEQGYRQVLARDADNRDAHMGLAAIAVRNGQLDTAREHYRAVLQRNPKDLTAHAALTDLAQNRPADAESQLKLLLTEQPQSAQLHFALANLYAEQQRWPYAQQAYFEAQRLAPEHPDYAFNLAVSLEHLGQARLALEYYRRALQLAGPHNAQFDLNAARQRVEVLIGALGRQAQP